MLDLSRTQLRNWAIAIFTVFVCSGLSISSWASRVPSLQEDLGINKAQIGLLLLASGITSIIGISTSPAVVVRTGARRGILACMLLLGAGISLIGLGSSLWHSVPIVALGLALFGFANGCVDVMMNVEAADIEQRYNRTMMPLFHALFSGGMVMGASIGWLASAQGWSVGVHLVGVAVLIAVLAIVATRAIPLRTASASTTTEKLPVRERLHAFAEPWRELRTYTLGIVMLGMSFAEGGAADWLALGVADDHGFGDTAGAMTLTVFTLAMMVTRIVGGPIVDRVGRVIALRVCAVFAVVGMLIFIYATSLPMIILGTALWGVGVALGFPLGMSAAADDPVKAAGRVSAAATIGYIAFLTGPPLLGFVAERIGLLNALLILVGLAALSGLFSGAAKPLKASATETSGQKTTP